MTTAARARLRARIHASRRATSSNPPNHNCRCVYLKRPHARSCYSSWSYSRQCARGSPHSPPTAEVAQEQRAALLFWRRLSHHLHRHRHRDRRHRSRPLHRRHARRHRLRAAHRRLRRRQRNRLHSRRPRLRRSYGRLSQTTTVTTAQAQRASKSASRHRAVSCRVSRSASSAVGSFRTVAPES